MKDMGSKLVRPFVVVVLAILAVPTVAQGADTFKDVFVRNTASSPVLVRDVDTNQLRQGSGFFLPTPNGDFDLPVDVVLTDLVITRLQGSEALCEVALAERKPEGLFGMQFFYLTQEDSTAQLHLQSGLMPPAGGWAVTANSECNLRVLWSGYSVP